MNIQRVADQSVTRESAKIRDIASGFVGYLQRPLTPNVFSESHAFRFNPQTLLHLLMLTFCTAGYLDNDRISHRFLSATSMNIQPCGGAIALRQASITRSLGLAQF